MPAHGLRPQAEGAARTAAAAGVDRHIGVLQVADEVVVDLQVALVDRRHEGQLVHVLDHRALPVVFERAVRQAVGQAQDVLERLARGHVLAGVVELLAADEVDGLARAQRAARIDRGLGADHADHHIRLALLQFLGELGVGGERGRAGVDDDQFIVSGDIQRLLHGQAVGRCVEHPAARHQRGGLRQPGRVPERLDLALGLIARARAAVEAVEGRGLEEKGFFHSGLWGWMPVDEG